jgi:hypothetical protein
MPASSPESNRRLLPRGWRDLASQLLLFAGAYVAYQLVRGLVGTGSGYRPFGDATTVINLERTIHVFVEPHIQTWGMRSRWLMDLADWSYLNAHYLVTPCRNESFYFVRNMFLVA